MTKPFRERLKLLHPDLNGGDVSRNDELLALLVEHSEHRRATWLCHCGCGRHPLGHRTKYYEFSCYLRCRRELHALKMSRRLVP